MTAWYDRDGNLIPIEVASRLLGDLAYKVVEQTQIGPYWVSTVWLGLDHNWLKGPPLIFETMVFAVQRDDPTVETLGPDIECSRYSTEEQARAGHQETCLVIRAVLQEAP